MGQGDQISPLLGSSPLLEPSAMRPKSPPFSILACQRARKTRISPRGHHFPQRKATRRDQSRPVVEYLFGLKCRSVQSMSNHRRIPRCATVALAAASTLFAVASGLAFYSGEEIAATVGDRYPSVVEQVAVWMGLLMQPWAVVAALFDSTSGINVLYRSVTATVVTSLISAWILFRVLRAIARHRLSWFVAMTIGLCVIAGISIYTFKIDMEVVERAISTYDGP